MSISAGTSLDKGGGRVTDEGSADAVSRYLVSRMKGSGAVVSDRILFLWLVSDCAILDLLFLVSLGTMEEALDGLPFFLAVHSIFFPVLG